MLILFQMSTKDIRNKGIVKQIYNLKIGQKEGTRMREVKKIDNKLQDMLMWNLPKDILKGGTMITNQEN